MKSGLVVPAIFLGLLGVTTLAHADDSAASAATRALYDDATRAMDKKDFATACPKLEEVIRQVPEGVGARITLGECYQGQGKLASAWNAFNDAAALAAKTGQTARAQKAHAAAEALHAKFARQTVEVAPEVAALPGLVVERDGVAIDPRSFGAAIPIDKGPHKVTARAPGRASVEKDADVAADATESKIRIDALPVAASDATSPPPVTPPPSTSDAQPATSLSPLVYVGFGVGAAGLAVGVITGAITLSKASTCKKASVCTQSSIDKTKTTAWISDVGFALGVAGAGVAVVALVTSPKSKPATGVALRVAPGALFVEGGF